MIERIEVFPDPLLPINSTFGIVPNQVLQGMEKRSIKHRGTLKQKKKETSIFATSTQNASVVQINDCCTVMHDREIIAKGPRTTDETQ